MPWSTRRAAACAIVALSFWAACGGTVALPDLVGAACTDECGPGLICYEGLCFIPTTSTDLSCASDTDCTGGTTCDVDAGFCLEGGEHCKGDIDCPLDETCVKGVCFLGYSNVGGDGGT